MKAAHPGLAALQASLLGLGSIGTFVTSPALAQTGADRLVATQVDTVRVVADRLPADVLRAPIAISEVQAGEVATARQAGLDDALDVVPGVIAQSRSGSQDIRITIRGFGARGAGERSNAGTTRGIRIQLDGFPLTEPDGRTSLDFADVGALERVRVMRSNASGLYGSASGGLIDLTTHVPFAQNFGELRTSTGSFGLWRNQLVGGLVTGAATIRLSVSDLRFDGWRRHSAATTTTVQASSIAEVSRRTSLAVFLAVTRNLAEQPGALTRAEFDADPRQADPTYVEKNYRRENYLGRVGLRLQHDSAGQDLLLLTAFVEPKVQHRAERNRYRDFNRYHVGGGALYRATLPFAPSMRLRWSNGIDDAYQDGTVLFYDLGPNGSRGSELLANKREAIHSFGAYSQLEGFPRANLEASVGARYDVIRYTFQDYQDASFDAQETLDHVSPRLSLGYKLGPSQSIYAAFSGGIEAPAYNEVDPPPPWDQNTGLNPFLEPATSWTIEAGTKGMRLLRQDGKSYVRYDAAAYGLEVHNDIIPWDGGAYYTTAGRSRRIGLEVGSELKLAWGLGARLGCTVSKNEYLEYHNDLGTFDGNESAGIPPLVLDARARYDWVRGPWVELGTHALGEYFADDGNHARVPAYGILNVTIGTRHPMGGGVLEGFFGVENVLDGKYVSSVYINGANGRFYEAGMERNFLLGLSYRTL